MRRRPRLIDFATALLLLGGSALLQAPHAAEPARGTAVRDLYYGEVLFHFYQRDDFTALTHLLAERQAGRLEHHGTESEILLGGLYLSYGQHERAGQIFERLLASAADAPTRDRAWFYLGKVRFQRGLYEPALEAFARVKKNLPAPLAAELPMLVAETQMALGRFDAAAATLARVEGSDEWLAYARYNLGVALVRLNRVPEGARLLDQVGRMDARSAEALSLRDKANVALGYAWLQVGDGVRAQPVLERVRLRGPFSTKALLGAGWASSMADDYAGALTPWMELTGRDVLDSAVQESFLAVPYALGRLKAEGTAVDRYQAALRTFDTEIGNLDAAVDRARSGELIHTLLAKDDQTLGRWYWQLDKVPDNADARYLYLLIANNEFHEGLKNYRDLAALANHLDDWRSKMDVFGDMVATRRQAFRDRLPATDQRLAAVDVAALRARRNELAARLDKATAEHDGAGLANARELDQWQRLGALERVPSFASPDNEALRERERLLKGVLLWELDRDFKLRAWRTRRSVAQLDRSIAQAETAMAGVTAARAREPARLDDFATRIAAVSPRISELQGAIAKVLDRQQQYLVAEAVGELAAQKERLTTYRVQARFALANLYDRAGVRQASAPPKQGQP